ncbi:hypothetical protein LSUE1_G005940 [Lachnellula suecica]|uniref:Fucose-specific lectin n=1 Tax=Lachnellula suecica TaxID=602035 RepID=A0A8T9C430_9HELO|nr:hypothetical protein LSUE1_G005940 [Lachnellula suecica]
MTVLPQPRGDSGLHPRFDEDSGLHPNPDHSVSLQVADTIQDSGAATGQASRIILATPQFNDSLNQTPRNIPENQQNFPSPLDTFETRHQSLGSNPFEVLDSRVRENSLATTHSIQRTEPDSPSDRKRNSSFHLIATRDPATQNPQAPPFKVTASQPTAELPEKSEPQTEGQSTTRRGFQRCLGRVALSKGQWRMVLATVILLLVAVIIILAVVYAKHEHLLPTNLTITSYQLPNVSPESGSALGAADVILGEYFSNSPTGKSQTKVVWDGGNGKLCVQTKLGTTWLDTLRCVTGANQMTGTPLALLDWVGGPSIAFITKGYLLSSINYVPGNDTWILSNLVDQKIQTHRSSKLASVTWLNGTSIWLYYQGADEQIHEFGLDDYRDESWRDGVTGGLGLATVGSSIGYSRWVSGPTEVGDMFFQAANGAIHGLRYEGAVWNTDVYDVSGTDTGVTLGASFTSTAITQANNRSTVLLAYIASNGFLTVQTRGTAANISDLGAFTKPLSVIQGDGSNTPGLAADGASGQPKIYLMDSEKVQVLTGDVTATNFTTEDVTS